MSKSTLIHMVRISFSETGATGCLDNPTEPNSLGVACHGTLLGGGRPRKAAALHKNQENRPEGLRVWYKPAHRKI